MEGKKKIFVNGSTGIGKTNFFLKIAYGSFKRQREAMMEKHPEYNWEKRKILLLTNRVALKEQMSKEYGEEVNDLVDFMNYQELIYKWKNSETIKEYDFVIADECHYFFSDATFSYDTDIALNYILDECKDSLVAFLSATPNLFISYIGKYRPHYFDFAYKIKKSHKVSICYKWWDEKILLSKLVSIPPDEKILYFRNNIKKNHELKIKLEEFFDVSTICSLSSSDNKKYCDEQELENIKQTGKFDAHLLISTTTLDNGINLRDDGLKHIVIDLLDLDTAVQCIGRKRLGDNESVQLYIKIPSRDEIFRQKKKNKDMLNIVNEYRLLPLEQFCRKYGREDLKGMLYPVPTESDDKCVRYEVNRVKLHKLQEQQVFLNQLIYDRRDRFIRDLVRNGSYEIDSELRLETEVLDRIEQELEQLVRRELFDDDKLLIMKAINVTSAYPLIKESSKTTIYNNFFEEHLLPFTLKSEKARSGENKNKNFWILKNTLEDLD